MSVYITPFACYRGVKEHQLPYTAIWRIKWQMFETWLSEHDEVNATKLAQNVVKLFQGKRG